MPQQPDQAGGTPTPDSYGSQRRPSHARTAMTTDSPSDVARKENRP